MKNKLIILVLLLTSWQAISQNEQSQDPYILVLADTLYWWELWVPEFENPECKEYTLTIYNILGKEIYKEQTDSDVFQIHASKIHNGIYIYVISAENKILYSDKFIVKI